MLEIRNVSKIYRSKTGEEVKALDNVSISFPETGMVFILGKSGSGKSTLLNVMGGLDSYDAGEFIIKGKSSNDFVGSDFDAYRNTFIGFIFQEYNVLDDFTVGANIGLALELQGKKATDEAVNGILAQVDLLNYAKRKPNELSGGQKQRVAIARALVKDPEIIMADEPTGALDSNTGKQIFDTLKELSKTKLVLIVSHDRDFAERYADRIVELADGKIIEDVTKHEHQAERVSAGVHRINDNILRIESGYKLTAADLEMINAYLAKNNGDVLLSGDGRVNEELRSAAGISKDGATTVFEGTDPEKDIKTKHYEKGQTKFIRSRLPMKNAVKMGSSGLKHKKFRLFMTILLSFISFAMFGLSSSMAAYDKLNAATESIIDSQIKSAAISLGVRYTDYYSDSDGNERNYTGYQGAALNDEDIAFLEQQTGLDFVPVFTGYNSQQYSNERGFNIQSLFSNYTSNTVYNARLAGLTTLTAEQLATTGYQVTGRMPQNKGEIAITEFMYRQFNEYGFKNDKYSENVEAGKLTMDENSTTGIIGKHITLNQIGWQTLPEDQRPTFKIVGVVNTNFDYNRYQNLMPKDENQPQAGADEESLMDMFLAREIEYERDYGFHALGFTVQDDIDALTSYMAIMGGPQKEFGKYMSAPNYDLRLIVLRGAEIEGDQPDELFTFQRVEKLEALDSTLITWFESGKTTLGAHEILISSNSLSNMLPQSAELVFDEAAFNTMGVAVYGEDVWNHAAITEKTAYSYAQRLEWAEMIAFINEKSAAMTTPEMQSNFGNSVDTLDEARTEWVKRWVTDGADSGVTIGSETLHRYQPNWQAKYCERAGVQTYIAALYGLTLPEHVKTQYIQEASTFLQSVGVGENMNNPYTFDRWGLNWVKNLYNYSDAIENEVWNNAALEAKMLEDQYQGIKNSDWNDETKYSADRKKETLINYFISYDNSIKEELVTYNYSQLEALRQKAYISICGITNETLMEKVYVEIRERENGAGDDKGTVLETPTYKIVGVFDSTRLGNGNYGDPNSTVISDDLYAYHETWATEKSDKVESDNQWRQERAEHKDGIYAFVIAAVNASNHDAIKTLVELSYAETEDYKPDLLFTLNNAVMYTLGSFNEIIEILAQVFMWVGLGLALFSSFLLMNFISTSISYKKREIGILRAVGARSSDVFKIFFSEAFIIALINFFLAIATSISAVLVLNWYMRSQGINITLLSFGPVQVALMLLISVAVAAIGAFLPVYKIAHKKPVDAIKDR
jgi:ABC-type lipoprotein export system ATPase subunit